MRYLIMECELSYAIALDEEGRFVKVPNFGYEAGQSVEDIPLADVAPLFEADLAADDAAALTEAMPERSCNATRQDEFSLVDGAAKKPVRRARRRFSIAAAACVLAVIVGSFALWQTPAGAVHMRINPQVTMEVNRFDRVVFLRGDNAEGKQLVAGYGFYGKRVEDVSQGLAARAREQGYLKPGGRVRIAADSKDAAWREAMDASLMRDLPGLLDDDVELELDDAWDIEDDGDDSGRAEPARELPDGAEPGDDGDEHDAEEGADAADAGDAPDAEEGPDQSENEAPDSDEAES